MGAQDRTYTGYLRATMGTLTTTGANETARVIAPSALSIPLLQTNFMTAVYSTSEAWRPVGIAYIITTGITVTAAVVTLRKNGVNALTGGTATLPIQALGANEVFAPFTAYTFAAGDAPGDAWSVFVTTTSTAGVVNPVTLVYGIVPKIGVSEGLLI
jgi:hypothetical protein